jgi:sensor histidine kinase YesM
METQKNNKALILFAHLVWWTLYIFIIFLEDSRRYEFLLKDPLPFIINFSLIIGYFYLNMNLLVPRLLSKKRIFSYIGVTLLSFFLFCFVLPWGIRYLYILRASGMTMTFPSENTDMTSQADFILPIRLREMIFRLGLYSHFIQFLVVFIVSAGLKVITQWYNEKQQLQELEKSKIQAELSFLKSQIHPHFLFNCLNSIYFLALSKDDKASKTILSLSDFLRFVIIESESDYIPLEKEIMMLEEYLNLQSLRTTEKFELQFIKDGDFSNHTIMPLTFIPFVENAFKFGISTHTNCFIHIRTAIENGMLIFTCDNSIAPLSKDYTPSSGVGLDNIHKRLELAYPNRHSLIIEEERSAFHVKLQIKIE